MSAIREIIPDPPGTAEPRRRPFTHAEYHRLASAGILSPEDPVELIDGDIILGRTGGERRRWSYEDYEEMGAAGVLGPDERLELIDGEILEMSPQGSYHAIAVGRAYQALLRVFGARFHVRCQAPLRITRAMAPEPDVALVEGADIDYLSGHPSTALLIIEVSDTTLQYDRGFKAGLYAQAGVPDYWVVDIGASRVEVRRDPAPDPSVLSGFNYRTTTIYKAGDVIAPLVDGGVTIAVEDLLPPGRKR